MLMLIDYRSKFLTPVRNLLNVGLRPLHHIFLVPRDGFLWLSKQLKSQATLLQQVNNLQKKNLQLNALAMREKQLLKEINQLRQLLDLREHLPLTAIPVEVLYDFQSHVLRKVMINHGSRKGIIVGSPVITKDGLVGQVTHVYPSQAEVTLITDRSISIPIENLRTGARAILQGKSLATDMEVLYQLSSADINIGDKLVTSGLDQYYPSGLPVANVIQVEETTNSTFAKILAAPTASVDTFIFALVIQQTAPFPPRIDNPVVNKVKNK